MTFLLCKFVHSRIGQGGRIRTLDPFWAEISVLSSLHYLTLLYFPLPPLVCLVAHAV